MRLRLMLGDTVESSPRLQDEELLYFISAEPTLYRAAANAALSLGSRYAVMADKQVGDLKISYQKISTQYMALAKQFQGQGRAYQVPSAGGIYVTDVVAHQQDDTVTHGKIRVGMHDFTVPPKEPNVQ